MGDIPTVGPMKKRGFAGFSYAQLAFGALLLVAMIWSMWATSRIFALEDRRVVSVRLAGIVNDFVSAEARSGTPPEQLSARTTAFMSALDGVLKKRAANGQVVLVGEAVVASSVPDVTSDVVADLGRVIRLPAPAAMPPAIMAPRSPAFSPSPSASPALFPAAPAPTSPQPLDPLASPFGGPSQPAGSAPQQ